MPPFLYRDVIADKAHSHSLFTLTAHMQFSKRLCFVWFNLLLFMWKLFERVEEKAASILNWIKKNPIKSIFMGTVLGSPAIDYYLKIETSKQLKEPVYNKLVKGSIPTMLVQRDSLEIVSRPQVMREIKMFLPQQVESHTHFGVILGPSGSGKTYAVRKVCNEYPHGVLYYEIKLPEAFIDGLSREVE